jgi:hypothetical protein
MARDRQGMGLASKRKTVTRQAIDQRQIPDMDARFCQQTMPIRRSGNTREEVMKEFPKGVN